jgi:hypothetical protein
VTAYLAFNIEEFTFEQTSLLLGIFNFENSRLINRAVGSGVSKSIWLPERPAEIESNESILQERIEAMKRLISNF